MRVINRKLAFALCGVLAVVCIALILSVVYPLSFDEAEGQAQFTPTLEEDQHITGAITVDGETELEVEIAATSTGERYQYVRQSSSTATQYQPDPDGPMYVKNIIEKESRAEGFVENVENSDDRSLVTIRDHDEGTAIYETDQRGLTLDSLEGTATVVVEQLSLLDFEHVEMDEETDIFRPRGGWFEEAGIWRITDASGNVTSDAETNAVETVSVSYRHTEGAGTYLEYLLGRTVGGASEVHEVTYEVTKTDHFDAPPWLDEFE